MASVRHADVASPDLLTRARYNDADAHVVELVDADIPSSIARDSEVAAAIAALSSVYQPLGSGGAMAGWADVTAYGAAGDGTTDDAPAIQAAIDAAGAAGGGVVWLPTGRYFLDSTQGSPSWEHGHLDMPHSRVSLVGAPGATLVAADGYPIVHQGRHEASFYADVTVRAIDGPVARGATSVTLEDPAHASGFSPGDHIVIRTGQTIPTYAGQPDAEINRVASASTDTGVVQLAWPTTKAYAQEWFASGTAGVTSTSETANPAPFGIANVEAVTVADQSYVGLRFEHSGTGPESMAVIGGQAVRTLIERCSGTVVKGFESRGAHRFTTVRGCVVEFHDPDSPVSSGLTVDTFSADALWDGNMLLGTSIPLLHVHEGAAGVVIRGNVVRAKGTDAVGRNCVSVRGRARDVSVVGNVIDVAAMPAIFVDETSGPGVIADNQVLGASGGGIYVTSPGWAVSGNHAPNGADVDLGQGNRMGADSDRRIMSAWVTKDDATVDLGWLPAQSLVIDIRIWVQAAFTPSGGGTISVGSPTAGDVGFAAGTDVKSFGLKTPTLGGWAGHVPDGHLLQAHYTQNGTAAGAGKALVIVEHARVGRLP